MAAADLKKPQDLSYRARWASIAIREQLAEIQQALTDLPNNVDRNTLVSAQKTLYDGGETSTPLKVGIVGAGAAGLFTAMLFDYFEEKFGLKVDYEILEANKDERVGGRLFSYYFPNGGKHDYFDVGAMRFPDIWIMKRTFELFEMLGMEKDDRRTANPDLGNLIPYGFSGDNVPSLYNDVQIVQTLKDRRDPSKGYTTNPTGRTFEISGVPVEKVNQPPGAMVSDTIKEYIEAFNKDPALGWKLLMSTGDSYSVRQYLTNRGWDYNTIQWCETFNTGDRWYDQAFSEMVLEEMDFDPKAKWWCVEGGAQQLAKRMQEKVEAKKNNPVITYGKRVTAMKRNYDGLNTKNIEVTVKGEEKPRVYDAVFNSATLGSMQRMDLTGMNLNWGTKQAIRSLGYGASCKVGVRFKNLWWIKMGIDMAGLGKTDLPIRTCVYPSYNLYDDPNDAGVLLVSYSWSQEAQRMGSLISRNSPADEEELKETLIYDLARLHASSDKEFKAMHKTISDAYESHFAYDWYTDPQFAGAFAFFGPGQFQNLYPWITRSDGKHMIIGECASAHHAWVVGALESSVRAVYQFLFKHSESRPDVDHIVQLYNGNKIPGPFGPLPAEYDRTEDVKLIDPEGSISKPLQLIKDDKVKDLSFEGDWARQQVIFETIRQEQGGDQLKSEAVKPASLTALKA